MQGTQKDAVNYFLLALVFLIPLQNIYLGKIPSLGGGMNILNILMVLAFFATIQIRETCFKNDLNKFIVWMAVIYFLSWVNSGVFLGVYEPRSIFALKDVLFSYLFFFVVYKSCDTLPQLKKVFWATVLPLPYMFKVYYTNLSWMGFSSYSDKLRLNGGTFMSLGSNEINGFYATYTFVVLSVAFSTSKRLPRYFLIICGMMNLYCIIYGFSRGAYLAVIIGLVVWAVVSSKVKRLLVGLSLFFFVGIVGVQVFPKATVERFEMSFNKEEDRDRSAQSRFEFWDIAFDYYVKNPVLGIGYGSFPKVNPAGLDTHNYYVKVMVENGSIGLIVFFLFLNSCWKKIRELHLVAVDPFLKAFAVGMVPCMIAMLIGNLFGDRFTHYPLISYFYVYMAIVMKGIELSRKEVFNVAENSPASG